VEGGGTAEGKGDQTGRGKDLSPSRKTKASSRQDDQRSDPSLAKSRSKSQYQERQTAVRSEASVGNKSRMMSEMPSSAASSRRTEIGEFSLWPQPIRRTSWKLVGNPGCQLVGDPKKLRTICELVGN